MTLDHDRKIRRGAPSEDRSRTMAARFGCWTLVAMSIAVVGWPASAAAQLDYDREPINYSTAPRADAVAQLQARLQSGQAKLAFDERSGYLPALLRELNISETSQVLVFSKTSFQRERISPQRPRALYFSDDVYVGSVDHGDVLEISAVDPQLGAVFYTLDQQPSDQPVLVGQLDSCTQCHASPMTEGVPGHLVRSVYPDAQGQLILSAGSFRTTDRSPLRERWGGWYVTGTHGRQRHLGNALFRDPIDLDKVDYESGANLTDLRSRVDLAAYRTPHSDIVALMVLEHQVPLHNQIAAANYRARLALREQEVLNKMLNSTSSELSPGIQRRLERAGDDVLKGLLFVGEAPLTDSIQGTAGFAESFAGLGPRDRHGRSLRDFDLQRRLFKYPCSYLIYSEALNALPEPVLSHILRRLWEIVTNRDRDEAFTHLTPEDRRAIYDILVDTKPDLPDYWKSSAP
jgi:hypothetical protein